MSIDPEAVDGLIPQKGVAGIQIISIAKLRYRLPKFKSIVSAYCFSTRRSISKGFLLLQGRSTSQGNFMIVFYAAAADTNSANNVSIFVF